MTVAAARAALRAAADPEKARVLQGFFKTGPGQYGEGDRFLGINVPALRKFAREFQSLSLADVTGLLQGSWHEERVLALFILVRQYERGDEKTRDAIYRLYLASTERINNWDLVDGSAPYIVGPHLRERSRAPLYKLAKSKSLWERRIAILATFHFIKHNDYDDALRIAEILLHDDHDLIHKAAGWMLREIGNRDRAVEEAFLRKHAAHMPRTMLRYAIEKFPEALRTRYLQR